MEQLTMRLALAAALALAACEGTASTGTPDRDRARVTAEDLDEVLGRLEDLERERDELRARVEALEATTGVAPGEEPLPPRWTVLARYDCGDPNLPLDKNGDYRTEFASEFGGRVLGVWHKSVYDSTVRFRLVDEADDPVRISCRGGDGILRLDEYVVVAL